MAVSSGQARELALAFPAASEAPHFHRQAFRTPRKIFAALDTGARDLNLMFDPDLRDFSIANRPPTPSPRSLAVGAARARRGAIWIKSTKRP
jgi:hypothetical protein